MANPTDKDRDNPSPSRQPGERVVRLEGKVDEILHRVATAENDRQALFADLTRAREVAEETKNKLSVAIAEIRLMIAREVHLIHDEISELRHDIVDVRKISLRCDADHEYIESWRSVTRILRWAAAVLIGAITVAVYMGDILGKWWSLFIGHQNKP